MLGGAWSRSLAAAAVAAAFLFPARWAGASGTEGASFLDIPVGGRPAALGGAYSALATDGLAPVWNPAGLGLLSAAQLAATHLSYVDSISYEQGSLALPVGTASGIGASVQYLHPKAMTERGLDGAELDAFSSHYGAYGISYGLGLTRRLSAGVGGKLIEARLGRTSARAFAGDAGLLYKAAAGLRLAFVATGFGAKLRFLEQEDRLPESYRAAAAWELGRSLSLAAEAAYDRTDLLAGRFGAEWRPAGLLALRAGYRTETARRLPGVTGVTAGFGLTFLGQRFDYAWVPLGDLGATSYFSVLIAFGKDAK